MENNRLSELEKKDKILVKVVVLDEVDDDFLTQFSSIQLAFSDL